MTIYIVTQGNYSDYHIVAPFTTREKAEEFVTAFNVKDKEAGDYFEPMSIEEYELDNEFVPKLRIGYNLYHVLMYRNGDTESVTKETPTSYAVVEHPYIWERSKAKVYKDKGYADVLVCRVMASDINHAVKIANEIRIQMIAKGEWDE